MQKLQGDIFSQVAVLREKDLAHPPFAHGLELAVAPPCFHRLLHNFPLLNIRVRQAHDLDHDKNSKNSLISQ
jgi:hypothetical protein